MDDAWDAARRGPRDSTTNLRTQFNRIIQKAGYEPWPKLFQNLHSSRETELAESFPLHVVTAWIGNSELVAAKHYLQVTDEHFLRATAKEAAQNAAQKLHETARNDMKEKPAVDTQASASSEDIGALQVISDYFNYSKVPTGGLEPPT
ncbi:MAG: hypothetical protein ACYTGQ_02285 [Planctomycetota bacterium]